MEVFDKNYNFYRKVSQMHDREVLIPITIGLGGPQRVSGVSGGSREVPGDKKCRFRRGPQMAKTQVVHFFFRVLAFVLKSIFLGTVFNEKIHLLKAPQIPK